NTERERVCVREREEGKRERVREDIKAGGERQRTERKNVVQGIELSGCWKETQMKEDPYSEASPGEGQHTACMKHQSWLRRGGHTDRHTHTHTHIHTHKPNTNKTVNVPTLCGIHTQPQFLFSKLNKFTAQTWYRAA